MRTVLFICTGNTCRSPMAEAIARRALEGDHAKNGSVFVASAGVSAIEGMPVTYEAIEALKRLGIEHRGSSKRLTAEMVRNADAVLGMTASHVEAARQLVRGEPAESKIQPIDPASDVDDPIGLDQPVYDAVADRLSRVIPNRLREVLGP